MNAHPEIHPGLTRLAWASLIVGLAALAIGGCLAWAAGLASTQQFFRAYLIAFLFWSGVTLGSLAIVALHHLTGGRWGLGIRRLLEIALGTVPLLVLFFIPLLFGLDQLYPWRQGPIIEHGRVHSHQMLFFALPFFITRAIVYFAIWLLIAYLFNRWSRQQDDGLVAAPGAPAAMRRLRLFSGPALILWGFTVSFAGIDWAMSLEPGWYSSIYGMTFLVGQALTALCFIIVVVTLLTRLEPFATLMEPGQFHDLGNLLLTCVILWAYLAFSQYLLIWSANLRDETAWYIHRGSGVWKWTAGVLIALHFSVPFFLLLSRQIKRQAGALAGVALLVFVLHWVDIVWTVEPAFIRYGFGFGQAGMDLAAGVGLGGVWLAAFLWLLKRTPVLTAYSRVLEEGGGE